jgi:DNA-binding beta-propeller fold protein YncE
VAYTVGISVSVPSNGVIVRAGGDYVWTYHTTPTNELNRWDRSDGTNLGTISLTSTAGQNGMIYAFDSIWITDSSGNLRRYATDDSLTATIASIGDGFCYASADGYLWVGSEFPSRVIQIDPATNTVVTTVATGFGNRAMAAGGGSVWTTNRPTGKSTVTRIDTATATVSATIDTSLSATANTALAYDDGYLLVGIESDDVVKQIDPSSDTVTATFSADAPTRATTAFSQAIVNDSEDLVLLSAGSLSEVDRIGSAIWNPLLLANLSIDGHSDELWVILNDASSPRLKQIVTAPLTVGGWGVGTVRRWR